MATDITADQLIINKMTLAQFNALKEHDPTQVYVVIDAVPTGYIPIGTIMPFAGTTLPDGFLWCQGAAVSRTTYEGLFSVIGTTYGAGDGNSTFNLPNCADRYILTGDELGELGNGSAPKISGTAESAGAHTHTRGTMNITGAIPSAVYGALGSPTGAITWGTKANCLAGGNFETYGLSLNAASNWTGSTSSAGSHTHTVSVSGNGYTRSDSSFYAKYIKLKAIVRY